MVSHAVGQKIKRQLKTVRDGDDLLLWASRLISLQPRVIGCDTLLVFSFEK
jgi:hypothetical protein